MAFPCCGGPDLDENSQRIEAELEKEAKIFRTTIKILLLGAGQTGKTTFMKQIQHIHANGFDQEKVRLFRRIIIANITDYAEQLVDDMVKQDKCLAEVEALKPALIAAERGGDTFDRNFGEALMKFAKKPDVQNFFKESSIWLQQDSCKYFFDRLPSIVKSNYEPSNEDIFRCRIKTTGIYELKFQIADASKRKYTFVLTDVGGQRSERNKWIHCFENVMAVIFFVDLSAFNLTLDEAPTVNRLVESIKLFDAICNSQWFKNTYMILFFNKIDLFKEKLQTTRFSDFVKEYRGENTYEAITDYVKHKFVNLNKINPKKPIYVHFTCATDTKNMKFVFQTISDVIVRNSLKAAGLM